MSSDHGASTAVILLSITVVILLGVIGYLVLGDGGLSDYCRAIIEAGRAVPSRCE